MERWKMLKRICCGLTCGGVLGGLCGYINAILHAPVRRPENPLAGEWYIIAMFVCVIAGIVLGALLGLLVSVVMPKRGFLFFFGILLASGIGCVVGVLVGRSVLTPERAAYQGTALTFFGCLVGGVPAMYWITKRIHSRTTQGPCQIRFPPDV